MASWTHIELEAVAVSSEYFVASFVRTKFLFELALH